MSGESERAKQRGKEELGIFVERFMRFMNLWTVYTDYLTKKYVPSVAPGEEEWSASEMGPTLMFVLYAFFYSLVEDSDEALNGFRVWREHFPDEEPAIAAVEARVAPFRDGLKLFRNRLGFHGSRSRSHESGGLKVFADHSGIEILEGMKLFKSLGAALLAKDCARQGVPGYDRERARKWIDSVTESALHDRP